MSTNNVKTLNDMLTNQFQDLELMLMLLNDAADEPLPGMLANMLNIAVTVQPHNASWIVPAYARYLTTQELSSIIAKCPELSNNVLMLAS